MRLKYTKEMVQDAVRDSFTWAEVCRKIGIKPYTGSQTHLQKRAKIWGIEYQHFLGQAHSKGKVVGPKRPIEVYLNNSFPIKSHELKSRLIKEGYKNSECELCGITQWCGEGVPLELDHKNSDHWDNRLENLQIICPNCHALETSKRRRCRPTAESPTLEVGQ